MMPAPRRIHTETVRDRKSSRKNLPPVYTKPRDNRPGYSGSYAMEAATSQHSCYYRSGYDISVGHYPKVVFHELQSTPPEDRRYFLTFRVSVRIGRRLGESVILGSGVLLQRKRSAQTLVAVWFCSTSILSECWRASAGPTNGFASTPGGGKTLEHTQQPRKRWQTTRVFIMPEEI